jgi:hypothetical protein
VGRDSWAVFHGEHDGETTGCLGCFTRNLAVKQAVPGWTRRISTSREEIVPLLDRFLTADLDEKAFSRFREMKQRYFPGDLQ